jgi:hypothetical protein
MQVHALVPLDKYMKPLGNVTNLVGGQHTCVAAARPAAGDAGSRAAKWQKGMKAARQRGVRLQNSRRGTTRMGTLWTARGRRGRWVVGGRRSGVKTHRTYVCVHRMQCGGRGRDGSVVEPAFGVALASMRGPDPRRTQASQAAWQRAWREPPVQAEAARKRHRPLGAPHTSREHVKVGRWAVGGWLVRRDHRLAANTAAQQARGGGAQAPAPTKPWGAPLARTGVTTLRAGTAQRPQAGEGHCACTRSSTSDCQWQKGGQTVCQCP